MERIDFASWPLNQYALIVWPLHPTVHTVWLLGFDCVHINVTVEQLSLASQLLKGPQCCDLISLTDSKLKLVVSIVRRAARRSGTNPHLSVFQC